MKKRLILNSLLLALILTIIAIPVFAYTYYASVSVTENGTQSSDMIALGFPANNDWMADNGFIQNDSANDTRIQTLGGDEKPHMVTENMTYFAMPVTQSGQTNLFYTMWNSALSAFRIVLGYLGYYTIADNASTEPSSNFTVELSGWFDTSYASANETYLDKTNAIKIWNGTSGNITAQIGVPTANVTQDSRNLNTNMSSDASHSQRLGERIFNFPAVEITEVQVSLLKSGAPAGNATLNIRNAVTDAVIGSMGTLDVTTLTGANLWYSFTTPVTVTANTSVRVSLEYSGGNAANYIAVGYQNTDVYSGGNLFTYHLAYSDASSYDLTLRLTTAHVQVSANGIPSGDKTVKVSIDSPFISMGVDSSSENITPVTDNLTLNVPLWQTECSSSPFTTIDSNALTATVAGGASWVLNEGYAFGGGGGDLISIPADPSIDLNGKTSLAWDLWIYPRSDGEGNNGRLLSKGGATNGFEILTNNEAGGIVRVYAVLKQATTSASAQTDIGEGFNINQWAHLEVTYNATGDNKLKIYKNGTEFPYSTQVAGAGALADDSAQVLYIGNFAATNRACDAKIGEIKFYSPLSSGESGITQNYNATKSKYTTGDIYTVSTLASVPDNANDWIVSYNGTMPYINYFMGYFGGNLRIWHQPTSMIHGTYLPDRAIGNSGVITWGTNPANIDMVLGSITSSAQTPSGSTATTPSRDLLPQVGVSDWFAWMDATKLNSNPLHSFVTIMSATTTISENQAWLFLGLAIVLLVTAMAVKFVPKHLAIAGVASGTATVAMVVMTIFPQWALVWLVVCVVGGWISERSPSL